MRRQSPPLEHLSRLTDDIGIVEHARFDQPAWDLGYCTDDAGRLLGVASSLLAGDEAQRFATVALGFLDRAYLGRGLFRLRLGPKGAWTGDTPSDDAIGRALQGLGIAVAHAPWSDVSDGALRLFEGASTWRSPHLRSVAHGALGAAAVLEAIPDHRGARDLIEYSAELLAAGSPGLTWPWPEERLSYGNALIPEARLAVAVAREDLEGIDDALALLEWLVQAESSDGVFSFTPVGGRAPSDPKPAFDQQPIEAWAMADACARAFACTGAPRWSDGVAQAERWFAGKNDAGIAVVDPLTGGGFDGLEPRGINRNQGAESTLAAVATMARAGAVRTQLQEAWS